MGCLQRTLCLLLYLVSSGKLIHGYYFNDFHIDVIPSFICHLLWSLVDYNEYDVEPADYFHCSGYRSG